MQLDEIIAGKIGISPAQNNWCKSPAYAPKQMPLDVGRYDTTRNEMPKNRYGKYLQKVD